MSRYLAFPQADPPHIEKLPHGTPRTDGQSFKEAKQEVVEYLRETRDLYSRAAKAARRLSPSLLSLADIGYSGGGNDDEDGEEELTKDGEQEEEIVEVLKEGN